MKRQDELGVGSSIILTIVFAVMAVFTYQTDSSGEGNPLAWIPGVGVVVGIIMTIIAAINASANVSENAVNETIRYIAKNVIATRIGDLNIFCNTIASSIVANGNAKNINKFI